MTTDTDPHVDAEARFAEWFRKNYPGPETIIHNPDWHAPKIMRAVRAALDAARPVEPPADEEVASYQWRYRRRDHPGLPWDHWTSWIDGRAAPSRSPDVYEVEERPLYATAIIERQQAEIARLKAEKEIAKERLRIANAFVSKNKARAEAAEAENADLRAKLAKAIGVIAHFQSYGCPACGGDCGSANPPVVVCLMRDARTALDAIKDDQP